MSKSIKDDFNMALLYLFVATGTSLCLALMVVIFIGVAFDGTNLLGASLGAFLGIVLYRILDKKYRESTCIVWKHYNPDNTLKWTKDLKIDKEEINITLHEAKIPADEKENPAKNSLKKLASKSLLDD